MGVELKHFLAGLSTVHVRVKGQDFALRALRGVDVQLIEAVYPRPDPKAAEADRVAWVRSVEAAEVAFALDVEIAGRTCPAPGDPGRAEWMKAAVAAIHEAMSLETIEALFRAARRAQAGSGGSDAGNLADLVEAEAASMQSGKSSWHRGASGGEIASPELIAGVLKMWAATLRQRRDAAGGGGLVERIVKN